MKFRPTHDKVLVRRLPEVEVTPGGIIIPETFREKPVRCMVLSAGSKAIGIEPGMLVLIAKYSGTEFEGRNASHLVVRAKDVLAVVEE
jgi:chaperonin GroES